MLDTIGINGTAAATFLGADEPLWTDILRRSKERDEASGVQTRAGIPVPATRLGFNSTPK